MSGITPETRAELARLLDAATPGPWAQGDHTFGPANAQCVVSISDQAMGRDVMGPCLRPALFDVELIVAAVNALPALLDELEEARAKLDKVRGVIDCHVPARDGSIYMDARELLAILDGTDES